MHIVSADWPCPHYLKIKMPSKIKKIQYYSAHPNWPTNCRSSSPITKEVKQEP